MCGATHRSSCETESKLGPSPTSLGGGGGRGAGVSSNVKGSISCSSAMNLAGRSARPGGGEPAAIQDDQCKTMKGQA